MFIKHGGIDGKIVNVLDEKQLTDEQNKSVKTAIKQDDKQTDISQEKKSGN